MHNPIPAAKSTTHPLMITAAVAVVLFCGVGSAAVLGWLPSSNAGATTGAPPLAQQDGRPDGLSSAAPSQTSAQRGEPPARAPQNSRDTTLAAAPCNSCGVVQSVREITTRAQGSGVGAAGGAVLGGLLGNQVGGGHGRQLATVAGAIGGAVAGNQIEGNMKAEHSFEIVVRLNDGSTHTLHRNARPDFRAGDPVTLTHGQLYARG